MQSKTRTNRWRDTIMLIGLSLCVATLPSSQAKAQTGADYPTKTVTLVVPYVPGGIPDVMARLLGQKLSESLKQTFVVENKPGAGGLNAAQAVLQAEHDGYTLFVADPQQWAIDPYVFKSLPFNRDFLQDFKAIAVLGYAEFFLAANRSIEAKDFGEFVKLAKANPGKFSYGSVGIGSAHHLLTEVLLEDAGIKMTHVPYKGGSQTDAAVLSGEVTMAFRSYSSVADRLEKGEIKVYGVANKERSKLLPSIPTFAEMGMKNTVLTGIIGLVAPNGTPDAVVSKINAEILKAFQSPDVQAKWQSMALEMGADTPKEFAARIKNDFEIFGRAAKLANLQPE